MDIDDILEAFVQASDDELIETLRCHRSDPGTTFDEALIKLHLTLRRLRALTRQLRAS
jgi:hypothetical protein